MNIPVMFYTATSFLATNPFIQVIHNMFNEAKGWIWSIDALVAIVVISAQLVKYKGADSNQRKEIGKGIRDTLIVTGVIFVIPWLVQWITTNMGAVSY